jgi:hypothetical protein
VTGKSAPKNFSCHSYRLNSSANQFAAAAGSLSGRPHEQPQLLFPVDFLVVATAVVADTITYLSLSL